MEAAIIAALTSLLSVVETVLPSLSAASSSTVIVSIVNALELWVPLVVQLFPSAENLFTSIRNIIAALSTNPATPAAQLATLQQLDAQVDTAFEAIAAQVDPSDPQTAAPTTTAAPT